MKTKNLSLKAYSALTIVILSQSDSDAQVVIKDFEPDLRMMNWRDDGLMDDTISVDIDENGIDDLVFKVAMNGAYNRLDIFFTDAVTGIFSTNDSSFWDQNLNFISGDTIFGTVAATADPLSIATYMRWITFSDDFSYDSSYKFFRSGYLGLSLNILGEQHYGWVRMNINSLGDQDYYPDFHTGSPLTIFEVAYNQTPGEQIICNTNVFPSPGTISFTDATDENDITDLVLSFSIGDEIDFSELRFFLVPSREDVINFSAEYAISLPDERYFSLPADSVSAGEFIQIPLPLGLFDISGDPFSSDKYYSGFYMKIPIAGDTSQLSLSSPFNVIRTELTHCSIHAAPMSLEYQDSEASFHIMFTDDIYNSDISEYGAGVVKHADITAWTEAGNDYSELDTNAVIRVPVTGDPDYDIILTGLSKDIFGNDLEPLAEYIPVVLGFGDGHYSDLMCFDYVPDHPVIYNTSIKESLDLKNKIFQTQTISFETYIQNFISGNFILELRNITGELLITENIITSSQKFSFPELADGIYIATIKEKAISVAVSKIILQK